MKTSLTGIAICALLAPLTSGSLRADENEAITPEAVDLGRPVDFRKDILPIFRANCLACHNQSKAEGELKLESPKTILAGSSSGEIVVPGKPDESYLYNVAARVEESYMPPMPNTVQAKKLTPQQLWLLRQWIIEGAKASSESETDAVNWQKINSQLNAIYALDADPWGRFVAAGRAGNVAVYDLAAAGNATSLRDPALKELSPQQQAHRDYVHAIAFHPSGEMMATSGYRVVKLWQRDFDSVASALPQDWGASQRVVVSGDRSVSALQNADGSVRVIGADGKVAEAGGSTAGLTLLAVGGSGNDQLLFINAEGGLVLRSTSGADLATSQKIEPAIKQAVLTASGAVILHDDGTIRKVTFASEQKTLEAGDVQKSAHGPIQQLQLAGTTLLARAEGSVVELRNADSLQVGVTIKSATANSAAAISPNAERVATVSPEGVAELWNAKDAKLVATLNKDVHAARTLQRAATDKGVRDARVNVVKGQVTEAEKRVTEQQESLKKADEAVKKATEALEAAKKKLAGESPKVAEAQKALEAKPDDAGLKKKVDEATKAETTAKDAVAAAEKDLQSANKSVELTKQAISRAEAMVGEKKKALAAVEVEAKAATDHHAKMTQQAAAAVSLQSVAFVNDELVAGAGKDGKLRIYDTADGRPVDSLPIPAELTDIAAVSAGQLLMGSSGNLKRVNPFPGWKLAAALGEAGKGQASEFSDRVLALAFSPDGEVLAAGGGEASRSGELTLWNVSERKLIRRIENAHSDTVCGVDISPDGKLLASAASDRFVKVFDLQTGEHIRNFEGHTHHVLDVSWKADGTTLVSAGGDNAIKVWNAETGEQTRTITTYKKQVTALEFIGATDEFLSSSGDKRVFRHRAANGGAVREFKGCPDYVYCSCSTADGEIVAAGCEDGILRIWNGKDGKILSTFKPF